MKSVLALVLLGCLVAVQSWTLRVAEPDVNDFLQNGEKLLDLVRNYKSSAETLVETADLTKILNAEVSAIQDDVSKSVNKSSQVVMKMAEEYRNQGRDVSTCVAKYTEQAAALASDLIKNAENTTFNDTDDVTDYLTEILAWITRTLSVAVPYWEAAKEEAAEPFFSPNKAAMILSTMGYYADDAKNNYDRLRRTVEPQPDDPTDENFDLPFYDLEHDAASCMKQQQ